MALIDLPVANRSDADAIFEDALAVDEIDPNPCSHTICALLARYHSLSVDYHYLFISMSLLRCIRYLKRFKFVIGVANYIAR